MINFQVLANATAFYTNAGFARVEVPWTVTKEISDITRPPQAKDFRLVHDNGKVLVASAEQSFLYQYVKGFLPKGKFQATTPCYRNENFDALHTKYFIKTELIVTDNVTPQQLQNTIQTCFQFFAQELGSTDHLAIVKTDTEPHSYDITYHGIEIGSYGIRKCDFLHWIYATGVAEPRFSTLKHTWATTNNQSPKVN